VLLCSSVVLSVHDDIIVGCVIVLASGCGCIRILKRVEYIKIVPLELFL